jgi:hypothetical protein
LGGELTSSPAVAANFDGRLEVFARGTDDGLYHMWQLAPGAGWSGWETLDGALASAPVVAANADGRLEVFARHVDNALYHKWQLNPGGDWSPDWVSLAGVLDVDTERSGITAVLNVDGRLEIFAIGDDRDLIHTRQVDAGGEQWEEWQSKGGGITSAPVVAQNADGRLEIFVRGPAPSGELRHIWQESPGGSWSSWESLSGEIFGEPGVGRGADGQLEVFALGIESGSYVTLRLRQTSPGSSSWDREIIPENVMPPLVVASNPDGRLEVFGRGPGAFGDLLHQLEIQPNGTLSGWLSRGNEGLSRPAIGANGDGRLEVFATDSSGSLNHVWQLVPGGLKPLD